VDGERESGRVFIDNAQEKTPIQCGDPEAHGGISAQAMGVPESDRIGGLKSVGLCSACEHARIIRSDRGSIFYLCRLSATDPRFAKYPRLPVLSCPGYRKQEPAPAPNRES